jgi:hypothetical protein
VTYDATRTRATATATGVGGVSLTGFDLSGTTHTNAGDYPTDGWTFSEASGNYNNASGTVHDAIAKATATVTVTPYSVTYDGSPHTATGTAKGVGGADVSGLDLTSTTHTNAGTYNGDAWTFTNANYISQNGTVNDAIAKANATIDVTPYSVTYDAAAHTATGTAKGVGGVALAGLDLSGTTHTNAGAYATDSWTFTDVTGNYNNTSGTVSDAIAKANASITVTPYSVTFDAAAHTATGTAKGVQNETLSGLVLTGTTHTNAGDYATDPWTFTDVTGNYNNTSGTTHDIIAKANATIVVTPYNVTYDATAHTATATATGVGSVSLTGFTLTNTTHTNAGDYPADAWSFAEASGNYNDASGTVHDVIAKATATIVVTPYNVTYDAASHTATGTAKGVGNADLTGLVLSGTTHTNAGTYRPMRGLSRTELQRSKRHRERRDRQGESDDCRHAVHRDVRWRSAHGHSDRQGRDVRNADGPSVDGNDAHERRRLRNGSVDLHGRHRQLQQREWHDARRHCQSERDDRCYALQRDVRRARAHRDRNGEGCAERSADRSGVDGDDAHQRRNVRD